MSQQGNLWAFGVSFRTTLMCALCQQFLAHPHTVHMTAISQFPYLYIQIVARRLGLLKIGQYHRSCGNSFFLFFPPLWIWSTEILFQIFRIFYNISLNLSNFGGMPMTKSCRSGKKNPYSRKWRENSRNLLEAFLRSRKEENLYGHCDMNNARRILSKGSTLLRGC